MTVTTNPEIQALQGILQASLTYFEKTTSVLTEEHSSIRPNDGALTAAQQIAHVARTVDWFMDGAFRSKDGFDMDFEAFEKEAMTFTSVDAAKAMVRDSYATAAALLAEQSTENLDSSLPEGPVMGGLPRKTVVSGIQEHTAHHRGALSVYARLAGATPPMPYM